MRNIDEDVRADGPELVWHGPPDAPTLLVLDPGGEAKHGLPATWRPLAEHLRIGWYRRPDVDAVERSLDGLGAVHLVTSGPASAPVLALAARHPGQVLSVTAVDPSDDVEALRRELAGQRVVARTFVSNGDDPAVRVGPPLPLGHPDVVGRLVETLLSVEPQHGELADDWQRIRESVAGPMRRARGDGGL
jgi:hypothetical protein